MLLIFSLKDATHDSNTINLFEMILSTLVHDSKSFNCSKVRYTKLLRKKNGQHLPKFYKKKVILF